MDKKLEKILIEGALALGADLDDVATARFSAYLDELKAWNRRINLISDASEAEVVVRHFLDSLTPYRFMAERGVGSLLDLGAGAGFPGIPLKIAAPGLNVVLVDSIAKKVHFIRHAIRVLGLTGIEAVQSRAEDKGLVERFSPGFDCVISRAFTALKDFIPLGLPYLRPGGLLVAMKGPRAAFEVMDAAPTEGLVMEGSFDVEVPFSERRTTLVVYRLSGG